MSREKNICFASDASCLYNVSSKVIGHTMSQNEQKYKERKRNNRNLFLQFFPKLLDRSD